MADYYELEATMEAQTKQINQELHTDTEHDLQCSQHYEVDGLDVTGLWSQIDALKDSLASARIDSVNFYKAAKYNKEQVEIANKHIEADNQVLTTAGDVMSGSSVIALLAIGFVFATMKSIGAKIATAVTLLLLLTGSVILFYSSTHPTYSVIYEASMLITLLALSVIVGAVTLAISRRE